MAQTIKNLPVVRETWVQSLGWEDPSGGEHGNPLWKSCLEFSLGQRSLVGYSAWGRKESDMTELLNTHTEQQNMPATLLLMFC